MAAAQNVDRPPPVEVAGLARAPERQLVDGARHSESPELVMASLRELAVRRSPRRGAVLTAVVADPDQHEDARSLAAVELGHDARPAHREALAAVLTGAPAAVVRRAAESLGRIGDEASYAQLRRLRTKEPVVRQAVDFARTLISYRLGLDDDLLEAPPPQRLAAVQRSAPMEIDFAAPSKAVGDEALAAAAREFPALRLSLDGALHFACNNDEFFVAFNDGIHRRKTLAGLGAHNAVLLTVMKRSAALQRYAAYLYVLTHPERPGRLRLFGVRPSGIVVLTGEADLADRRADFRVGSLATPHLVPVTVEATYDHDARRIGFVTTIIDSDFAPGQKGSKAPKPSAPSGG